MLFLRVYDVIIFYVPRYRGGAAMHLKKYESNGKACLRLVRTIRINTKLGLIGHHLAAPFPPYQRCRLSTFTHRRYSAQRKRRQRRAGNRRFRPGWSRLPLAAARLLFTHRRYSAQRKRRQRRAGNRRFRLGWSRLPLAVARLLCASKPSSLRLDLAQNPLAS